MRTRARKPKPPTKKQLRDVIEEIDDLDLPDGAHWQMIHDHLGLEYGVVFDMIAEDPEFYGAEELPGGTIEMKRSHIFEADDGTTFAKATDCKHYEEGGQLLHLLSNLSHAEIQTALDRTDTKLADAFERVGSIIAAERRESGELKRVATPKDTFKGVEKAMQETAK